MIVVCDQGGEHKACDKCRRVINDQKMDANGALADWGFRHALTGPPFEEILLCSDCRIAWDARTREWLTSDGLSPLDSDAHRVGRY